MIMDRGVLKNLWGSHPCFVLQIYNQYFKEPKLPENKKPRTHFCSPGLCI